MPRETAPGTLLPERRVRARNLYRDAANRIHDDATARRHGYAGALVAGVTIYGYLSRLAVTAWGLDWLRRGTATVRFLRPVYDGDELTLGGRVVARSANPVAGEAVAELEARTPGGEVAATMVAGLAWGGPIVAPDLRGYPAAPLPESPPDATEGTLAALGPLGTPALALDAATLAKAADDLDDPSPVYRAPDGVAHPGLLLRQANRALSENLPSGRGSTPRATWRTVRGGGGGPPRDAGPRGARLRAEGTRLGRPRPPRRRERLAPGRPHPPHGHLSPGRGRVTAT